MKGNWHVDWVRINRMVSCRWVTCSGPTRVTLSLLSVTDFSRISGPWNDHRLFDCTAGRRGRFIKNEKSYPQNWYEFLRPIKLKNSSIRYPHYRLSGHSHGRRFSTEYTRKGEQLVRYSYFNIGRIEKLHRRQAEYYERRRHCDGESLRNSLFPSSVLDNFQIFVDYKAENKIETKSSAENKKYKPKKPGKKL